MRKDWINAFVEATSYLDSPKIFRTWGAISCLAGAMERKVWVTTPRICFPTLYTIFVADPGVGKSDVTSLVHVLWSALKEHHIASTSLTKAALMDELHHAARRVVDKAELYSFNSLLIVSNELGVLIPAYDSEFMNVLTDMWDGKPYGESRRASGNKFKIEKPQIHILAGCTPSYLTNVLPEGAWDQGFLARCHLVYAGGTSRKPLFEEIPNNDAQIAALTRDLIQISSKCGPFRFTAETVLALNNWHIANGPPTPDHPRLKHYLSRRTQHLLKLCMIACISEQDEMTIEIEHYRRALAWLLEVERFVPDIFKAMISGGDGKVIEDLWHYIQTAWNKGERKKAIPRSHLIQFLQSRTPAHNIERIIDTMVNANALQERFEPTIGKTYTPRAKESL